MGNSSWVSLQGQIERLKQKPQKTQAISSISIQTASSRRRLLAAKDPSGLQTPSPAVNTYESLLMTNLLGGPQGGERCPGPRLGIQTLVTRGQRRSQGRYGTRPGPGVKPPALPLARCGAQGLAPSLSAASVSRKGGGKRCSPEAGAVAMLQSSPPTAREGVGLGVPLACPNLSQVSS